MKKLNVKVFDKFWLRNCYYHDLYSGLSCLGIDTDGALWTNVALPDIDLGVAEEKVFAECDNEKLYGYAGYKCNVTEKTLKESIDLGFPVIVGVDRCNLEKRAAINGKLHAPHFLLVYGYDEDSGTVNIIDHDEVSSYKYKEKTITADNLFLTNTDYKEGIGKKYTHTCKVLYRTNSASGGNLLSELNFNAFDAARGYSKQNLARIKEIFDEGGDKIAERFDVLTEYLKKLKRSLSCLREVLKSSDEALNRALNAYSKLLIVLWKGKFGNDFGFISAMQKEIFEVIDTIRENEGKSFENLLKKGEKKNGNN